MTPRKPSVGLLQRPTKMAPAASMRSTKGQYMSGRQSFSARMPPSEAGQPGLKSKRSFIAVGTPCRGPSSAPDMTASSALRAAANAPSKSVKTMALRLGFRASIRAITACITSTGESLRSRICFARSAAERHARSLPVVIAISPAWSSSIRPEARSQFNCGITSTVGHNTKSELFSRSPLASFPICSSAGRRR